MNQTQRREGTKAGIRNTEYRVQNTEYRVRSSSFIVSRAGGPLRLLTLALWFSASMFIANAWAANLGPLQSAPGTRITARLGPWAPARQSSATDTSRAPMGYYSRLPHIRRPASGVRRPAFFGSPNYSADSILRDDYLANDDQIGSGQHIGPRLAFDSAGNCVVTWQDTRNGDLDIYAQRLDYSGSRVGTNFRVVDDPDMWYQGTPAVGVAQGGSFMIAWKTGAAASRTSIPSGMGRMARRLTPTGLSTRTPRATSAARR